MQKERNLCVIYGLQVQHSPEAATALKLISNENSHQTTENATRRQSAAYTHYDKIRKV